MSLIKKSDVHRHTSTRSRADRQIKRPYGAETVPVKSGPSPARRSQGWEHLSKAGEVVNYSIFGRV